MPYYYILAGLLGLSAMLLAFGVGDEKVKSGVKCMFLSMHALLLAAMLVLLLAE